MASIWKNCAVVLVFCAITVGSPRRSEAQSSDANLPDNPSPVAQAANQTSQFPTDREETWRALPRDFLHDQKAIWLSPIQLGHGRGWIPVFVVAGGTAGLIYADPHTMPYFRNHAKNLDDLNDVFDPTITTAEVVAIPVSLLTVGYIRHDTYAVSTALLAADAYADSAVVDLVAKAITRRERPSDVPAGAPFTGTFFNGGMSPFKGSSFPSGHSAGAFSIATVVATRYSRHRWVPWAAYGFATVISLSRITSLAHFPSDVFSGAALGYTVTRFQVLRPR